MATVNYVQTATERIAGADYISVLWETLTTTNADGQAFSGIGYGRRSVQLTGTLSTGGEMTLQGSNDGGTTWATLSDIYGNAIVLTALGIVEVGELTGLIRPFISNGDGSTDLDVTMFAKYGR